MSRTSARRRLAQVVAATALGAAVLVGQAAAQGAAETCQGVPATIIGSPGATQLLGTESADVIVSNGSRVVASLGGDDVICLTSSTGPRDKVTAFAGAGDDRVVNLRNGRTTTARVDLGEGNDVYVGSAGKDNVYGIDSENVGIDRVRTGEGNDRVASGEAGQPNADDVDLGPGRDELELLAADNRAARFVGGSGSDELSAVLPRTAGSWRLDNATGAATRAGTAMIVWSSFERFALDGFANGEQLTFVGGRSAEEVTFSAWWIDLAMGGGDDTIIARHIMSPDNPLHRSRLAGGSGRDKLQFITNDPQGLTATGDLGRGRLVAEDEGTWNDVRAEMTGIEDLAFQAPGVRLLGDGEANRLIAIGCVVRGQGRGGPDRIVHYAACSKRGAPSQLLGGPGNDRITGSALKDKLTGGAGRDVVEGLLGRDICRAEVERSCERN
ncbi:hypothetical protein [Nocardioides sp. LHG3406-4]|uniref:hypothetical protein n=1 Tax=Nocardioides sp. LHG3406-4 TaxID=2804575 RepID=UPI003CE92A31